MEAGDGVDRTPHLRVIAVHCPQQISLTCGLTDGRCQVADGGARDWIDISRGGRNIVGAGGRSPWVGNQRCLVLQ